MKIVVLDGYAGNPGDLSWDELGSLGELTVYDRTPSATKRRSSAASETRRLSLPTRPPLPEPSSMPAPA